MMNQNKIRSRKKLEEYKKKYDSFKKLQSDADTIQKELKEDYIAVKDYYLTKIHNLVEEMNSLGLTIYIQKDGCGEEFLRAKTIKDVGICFK